ncbi:MAG: YgaP family membrane protein [bacterium]
MANNIDHAERFIRIVVGLVFGNLGFANPGFSWLQGQSSIQVVLVLLGLYFVSTGLVGCCPVLALRRYAQRERHSEGGGGGTTEGPSKREQRTSLARCWKPADV